jgi:hypothetical protein
MTPQWVLIIFLTLILEKIFMKGGKINVITKAYSRQCGL